MTSNEKKVLKIFKEIKQGNTVTMAGTLRVTIGYAYDVCKKLCEKGYLERLSPGRFALYKITSLGEEQVRTDVETKEEKATERSEGVPQSDSEGGKIEEIEEYECVSCGATVKEDDTECPKCGTIFEGYEEEPEEERLKRESSPTSESPSPEGQSKEIPQPTPQAPEDKEGSVVEGNDNVDEKKEILNHPSVPEDWKTCNWKWK